jgi:hypothetical protein
MKHKIHPFKQGGFFHCVECPCEELPYAGAKCGNGGSVLDIPEQTLLLFSNLGVKIGIDL